MTPELQRRINRVFSNAACYRCDGSAIRGQSPSNPGGDPCDDCSQTGIADDGTRLEDVREQINEVINGYIKEFEAK